MKNLINKLLSLCLINIFFIISCSKDTVNENNSDNSEDENGIEATETCFISDFAIQENSSLTIDCLLDLEGQTINIPAGVTFIFGGGDVFNGTLSFSETGKIDGELLNSELHIEGDVSLTTDEFIFKASRWDIIEGDVTLAEAESNKVNFNKILQLTSSLSNGILNFNVNEFDAFFKVDGVNEWDIALANLGIKIPSNFNLISTDKTFFRMYPNANIKPTLIYIGESVENITISGGNFIGDRDQHDYSDGENHEWGHILRVGGANNITITGATFSDATGDGIDVHAFGHSFDSNHVQSTEIFITNNTFERNRRNQISVTSGEYVYIENNNFIDASIHTDYSEGIAPGFAIDIEAYRANGIEYEIAENIFIRNNIEKGSRIGSFTIHTGDLVTIENNEVENFMSYSNTYGSSLLNNTITSVSENTANGGVAILAGRADRYDLNYDNSIIGNKIIGYGTGITITNVDVLVGENELINCDRGIVLEDIERGNFYDNKIISNIEGSTGYSSGASASFINDVIITQKNSNETLINVDADPFKFININTDVAYLNYSFNIENNIVYSESTSTFAAKGIIFYNNEIKEGGIRLSNAQDIDISNNIITTTTANAIRIDSGCSNIDISDNSFTTNQSCVFENNTDAVNVVYNNNKCVEN